MKKRPQSAIVKMKTQFQTLKQSIVQQLKLLNHKQQIRLIPVQNKQKQFSKVYINKHQASLKVNTIKVQDMIGFKQNRLGTLDQYNLLLQQIQERKLKGPTIRIQDVNLPGFNVQNICKYTMRGHSLMSKRLMCRQLFKKDLNYILNQIQTKKSILNYSTKDRKKKIIANYVPSSSQGDGVVFLSQNQINLLKQLVQEKNQKQQDLWIISKRDGSKQMNIHNLWQKKEFVQTIDNIQRQQNQNYLQSFKNLNQSIQNIRPKKK